MAGNYTARSRPYLWPWHGAFAPERTALLVVWDGENALPGGEMAALLTSVAILASRSGVSVGELPDRGGRTLLSHATLDFTVRRPHLGGFTGTDLDCVLRRRGVSDLIFAGFPFELGADCTMRQANDLGYECLALSDCCTGATAETLAGALSSIQMSGGIFGAVAESPAILELFAVAQMHGGAPIGAYA